MFAKVRHRNVLGSLNWKGIVDVSTSIAILAVAGALMWTLLFRPNQSPQQPPRVESVDDLVLDTTRVTHVEGSGRVALVEFSDFQCPFCRLYAKDAFPRIMREFVKTGIARYVAVHFPLEQIHPLALQAAEAAECAGEQGQFWPMRNMLFTEAPGLEQSQLLEQALLLGIDHDRFRQCLERHDTSARVRAELDEGRRLGVVATPAFFVGLVTTTGTIKLTTRIYGGESFDLISREVKKVANVR
jgi:protein-disulfide isomerase